MGRSNVVLKAIETRYQGYRFRSRLEARWAVFLTKLGEAWVYEPEGFALPSGCYLPDFWLPRLQVWLEIKPEQPSAYERQLCEELAYGTGRAAVIGKGLPTENYLSVFCYDSSDSSAGEMWWDECQWSFSLIDAYAGTTDDGIEMFVPVGSLAIDSRWNSDRTFRMPGSHDPFPAMLLTPECSGSCLLSIAATRAKSARFEHGEQG